MRLWVSLGAGAMGQWVSLLRCLLCAYATLAGQEAAPQAGGWVSLLLACTSSFTDAKAVRCFMSEIVLFMFFWSCERTHNPTRPRIMNSTSRNSPHQMLALNTMVSPVNIRDGVCEVESAVKLLSH